MLELLDEAGPGTAGLASVWSDVVRVCKRIPPLWDLDNYVAVNPFLGFAESSIAEAAPIIGDGLDAQTLPGVDFYRRRWAEGGFGADELTGAARRLGQEPRTLRAVLDGERVPPERVVQHVLTFAERLDRDHGTHWHEQLVRWIARWCAVHVSEGGSYWSLPVAERGLYETWLEAARVDRSLEIAGLRGWRDWTARLPARPDAAIAAMLERLEVSSGQRMAYLYRLLGGVFGWACYLRRDGWEQGDRDPGVVADLLAIRICADAAVAELASVRTTIERVQLPTAVEDEAVRLVFQEALEDGYMRGLLSKLTAAPRNSSKTRPTLQAVFCIDVRSEPLRRHLEVQAAGIETRGFAGFFGVALDWHAGYCSSARCPVLLKPGASLRAAAAAGGGAGLRGAIKHLQSAPAVSFSFVEVLGLAYGIGLAGDGMALWPSQTAADGREEFDLEPDGQGTGLTLAQRVELAAGILKNMGLRETFARLILLCGHEGQSANNPHAAGLDCGACGGHGGAINARVAAALLNDPNVRSGLSERGWNVPADTHFIPGVHNTTIDEVCLLDAAQVPTGHATDKLRLRGWLKNAGAAVRRERAADLGLDAARPGLLDRLLRRRARDWSEVRPEWGLARNAAFIAARRLRTRDINLHGRAFLHEYDSATDPDDSILTLILTAPMVVASWINLQYFASTVDNRAFGCGTKTLHNRIGSIGVVLGNSGDLRTGLATQSVHAADGRWFHEPLRLQVVIEATPERIERVLAAQQAVRELADHGWVRLFALDRHGAGAWQRIPSIGWQPYAH